MSTPPTWIAWRKVTLAVTQTTWNSEVPITTAVGIPRT
jgi:hypothetical protein